MHVSQPSSAFFQLIPLPYFLINTNLTSPQRNLTSSHLSSKKPSHLAHPYPPTPHPKMSQSQAQKRLLVEYRNLTNDPPDGITAGPTTEDDMFIWEALIEGPAGTPFEGGIFPAEMKFPKDYPLSPPTMRFLCEVWHPNGECWFLLWEIWG